MSTVLAFPNRRVSPVVPMEVDDAHIEPMEVPPMIEREPKAAQKVALPLPVFERLVEALSFYARQGFDHGQTARNALGAFNPQPQESA